jgi:biopolymer transport protein ExbD
MAIGDSTHSNKTGGVIQAGLIAKWIQDADVSASQYVIQPVTAYGENPDGEYVFTIKDSKFTAKDNSYVENEYWSNFGQKLFDSIGGNSTVEPEEPDNTDKKNIVSLDFSNSDTMNTYEAEDSYTDGEYTGTYTNESGQSFDVVVYKSGISYYNHQSQYGTKATVAAPVFSFVADEKAMYTLTFGAGTGSGTITLYTDAACTNAVVSGATPGSVVYKKATDDAEIIYVAISAANNYYMSTASIKKEELPTDVKVKFTGDITGVESDDTNVVITLKGSTETLTTTVEEYKENGIELIVGETYTITAKGDKGVYIGTDIVTDESGTANLIFDRIRFEFPLDFAEYYDDYKTYLNTMDYGNFDLTDPYSGVIVHPNGIVMTDSYKQYGVKTNANSIISFTAEKTGACTVSFTSTVSNSDTLILKVNDVYAPNLVSVVQGNTTQLTVMVNEGDKVTLYSPTRSNLWYKLIDVKYNATAFVYANSVVNGEEALIYGAVPEELADNIESVGFIFSSNVASSLNDFNVSDESSMVYEATDYNGTTYSVDGNYVFGTVLTDITKADKVYVYTFCKSTDGKTYYSVPVEVNLK